MAGIDQTWQEASADDLVEWINLFGNSEGQEMLLEKYPPFIHRDLLDIGLNASLEDWINNLIRLASQLGFCRVNAGLAIEHADGAPVFRIVGNTPEEYSERASDRGAGLRDPVMKWLKENHTPIAYSRATYVDQGVPELWEEQAEFGYKTGIAVSVRLSKERHFVFGVDRDFDLPMIESDLLRLMADVQLLASFSVESALRWLDHDGVVSVRNPRLTAREREVLKWTMDGKSTWVISTILGLKQSTVDFHIRNVMKKLDVSSRHVAAMRAASLGLI